MDSLDLTKVSCRICITGNDKLSNLFTKKVKECSTRAKKLIDDENVLDMILSEALELYTTVEVIKICSTISRESKWIEY